MFRCFVVRNPCHHHHPSFLVTVSLPTLCSLTFCRRHVSTIDELPPSDLRTALNKPLADFINEDFSQSENAKRVMNLPDSHFGASVGDYIGGKCDSTLVGMNKLLGRKLWRLLPDLITKKSSAKLVPGNVQRHTAVFPYGIVARNAALEEAMIGIRKIEKENESSMTKEKMPLILVVGITRQGKTAFSDNVANNFGGVLNSAYDFSSHNNVFCVNITFNSRWALDYKNEFKFDDAAHAFEQFAIRAIAAAADAHKNAEITTKIIVPIVELVRPTSAQLSDLLRSRLKKLHGTDPFLVFLADEITNFDRYLPNEAAKVAFSVEIRNLIAFRTAVIQSGFTTSADAITLSGRHCHHCVLHPLSSPELRRQASAMSTMFFQQIAASFALAATTHHSLSSSDESAPAAVITPAVLRLLKDSYFYFELIKSSAGSLGVVLENLVRFTVPSLKKPLADTIVLASLEQLRRSKINACLAWKSIQFCSYDMNQTTYSSSSVTHEAFFAMCDAMLDAGTSKLVYLPTSRLRWKTVVAAAAKGSRLDDALRQEPTENCLQRMELERKQNENDGRSSTSLSQISVEPIYVFFTKDSTNEILGENFRQFADMLMNYSTAMHALPYVSSPCREADFGTVFAEELKKFDVNSCCEGAASLLLLRRIVGNRFLVSAARNDDEKKARGIKIQTDLQGRDTSITAYFFEDAITMGISAQKSLRASLYENREKTDVTKLDASVDDFLENSSTHEQHRRQAPIVRWIDKEIQNPTATKCFAGSFPWPSSVAPSSSVSSQDFNRDTILRPERPENNALVDIIFHERIADDDNKEGVVQFWVDAKHRHARHSSSKQTPDRFAALVAETLENPTLRAKSPQSGKRIIHSVVHIIVSPEKADSSHSRAISSALEKKLSQAPSGGDLLPDYYFYFVDPDSVAFENLVSQPIARAMPLMDQQCLQSWRQRCSVNPSDWATYKTTLQHHGLEHVISNSADFREWRQLRLLDDSVSTLRSCFRDSQDSENFIRELLKQQFDNKEEVHENENNNNKLPTARDIMALRLLAFGAILEKVGVLHNDAHKHDRRLTFLGSDSLSVVVQADEEADDDVTKRASRLLLNVTTKAKLGKPFVLNLNSNRFREFLKEKVTMGQLIDGHHGEFGHDNVWEVLFNGAFLMDFKNLLEKVKDQLQPILEDGRLVHWVDRDFWERNPSLIGTMLFNLPFKIWYDNTVLFETNNAFWNKKNQVHRRQLLFPSKSPSCTNQHQQQQDLWENDEPLILNSCWDSCFYASTDDSPQQLFKHRNSELCFLLKMMQMKYKSLEHDSLPNRPDCTSHHRSNFIKFISVVDRQVENFLLKTQQQQQQQQPKQKNNSSGTQKKQAKKMKFTSSSTNKQQKKKQK